MNFIIALFGLMYWSYRFFDETVKHKQFEKRIKESNERYKTVNDRWIKAVVDKELEDKLWDYVVHPLNYDEVWGKIYPVMQKFPSMSKIKKLCFNSKDAGKYYCVSGKRAQNAAKSDRRIALRILMAKQGKLMYSDATFVISKEMNQHCSNEDFVGFLFWIQEQLDAHGVHEELVVKNGSNYYYLNDNTKNIIGNIWWYPVVARIDNIKKC